MLLERKGGDRHSLCFRLDGIEESRNRKKLRKVHGETCFLAAGKETGKFCSASLAVLPVISSVDTRMRKAAVSTASPFFATCN